jgi:hypothetical protein
MAVPLMPIKPENRHRYPANWKQIRARIQVRAGDKCEECGVPNGAYRIRSGPNAGEWTTDPMQGETWICCDEEKVTRIVCTTSHTNHHAEDVRDENLRFLCQRCHLRHDRQHHIESAYASRRRGKAQDMFP